jgi:broad specificity phosphatase PhoE
MQVAKTLYIIRHGQTDFNKQNIIQGSGIDSDLNVIGRLQAESFYDAYKDVGFDLLLTSTLKRAVQSVEHFINEGIPHIPHHGLNEINWGMLEGTKSSPSQRKLFEEMIREWKNGNLEKTVEGGESPLEMKNRQMETLNLLLASPAKTILIASHGRALRSFMCLLTGRSQQYMHIFPHTNLGLYVLEQQTDTSFIIKTQNDTGHLADALITSHF